MRKPWTVVGAPNYEAAMSLLEEIRSPPFSGCAHTLEWKAIPWGNFWATPSFIRQLIFLMEGNDLCIVGGQGDALRKHHLEEGDQRLETELAATSHIGLLSSFSVYFPGTPPARGVCCQQCSAAGHAVHSALSLPLLGDTAHLLCCGPPCLLHQPYINYVSLAQICWIVAAPCVPGWSWLLCCKLSDPGNLCSSGPKHSLPLPCPEFIFSSA